jgi:hypothetical protein
VAEEGLPDDADAWRGWFLLGRAGRIHAELTEEREALVAACAHLDRALAHDIAPDHRLIRAHSERLVAEQALVDRGLVRVAPGAPAGTCVLRDLVEAGHLALRRAVRADPDVRAMFAGMLGIAELSAVGHDEGTLDRVRVRGLFHQAATARQDGDTWRAVADFGLGMLDTLDQMDMPGSVGGRGIDRLHQAMSGPAAYPELTRAARVGLMAAVQVQAGNNRDMRLGPIQRRLGDRAGWPADAYPGADDPALIEAFAQVMELALRDDLAGAAALLSGLEPMLDDDGGAPVDRPVATLLRSLAALINPATDPPRQVPSIERPSGLGGVIRLMTASMQVGALVAHGVGRGDADLLRTAVEHADAVAAAVPAGHGRLELAAHAIAGVARHELAKLTPDRPLDRRRTLDHHRRAIELAGGHHHSLWPRLAMGYADALRVGDRQERAQARAFGMSALAGHAWQVFAQAGTEDAITASGRAAADARTVARWCLADRDAEPAADADLVAALDAGRALVLRAVTSSRAVPELLTERGRADLAHDWRATQGHGRDRLTGASLAAVIDNAPATLSIPDDLRSEVLRALGGTQVAGFDPVTVAGIHSSLHSLDADALVYLMAAENAEPGVAVVIPAGRPPLVRRLPELRVDPASPVHRFALARSRARDAVVPAAAVASAEEALDRLCAWAWPAAMGEVLRITARLRRGGPVRLVLVPLGMLSVVPWHAASVERGGRIRYAIDDAVISYAPSASVLSAAPPAAGTPIRSSLIIGDPGDDLRFAGLEARAVHRRFYPDGTYFGRLASAAHRPGSPEDVLAWVDASPPGPSMLHIACHAVSHPDRPADTRLLLAGGSLSVRTLLDRARLAAVDLEQVFLAACATGVPGSDHDEVLSLAASFLAAGARTVVGSLWPVPDEGTSVLMYMVHHFLRAYDRPAADALRQAQRWMVDPRREPPRGMPDDLRRGCGRGTHFGPLAWAGFTHLGR